jgi:hypothetical protein
MDPALTIRIDLKEAIFKHIPMSYPACHKDKIRARRRAASGAGLKNSPFQVARECRWTSYAMAG